MIKKIERAYYYMYYTYYKLWNKNYNPLLSTDSKAGISITAVKAWLGVSICGYISTILKINVSKLTIGESLLWITPAIIIISYKFSLDANKLKTFFKEVEKWPKRKRIIRSIIVWIVTIFIFVNVFISVKIG